MYGAVAKRINLLQLPFLCEGRKNSEKDMHLLKTENAKEDPPVICRVENAKYSVLWKTKPYLFQTTACRFDHAESWRAVCLCCRPSREQAPRLKPFCDHAKGIAENHSSV